jgi:hypothetical protein
MNLKLANKVLAIGKQVDSIAMRCDTLIDMQDSLETKIWSNRNNFSPYFSNLLKDQIMSEIAPLISQIDRFHDKLDQLNNVIDDSHKTLDARIHHIHERFDEVSSGVTRMLEEQMTRCEKIERKQEQLNLAILDLRHLIMDSQVPE